MSIAIIMAETGTVIASLGMATLGVLDSDIERNLSQGTTQMVMAAFIIMLTASIIALFTILLKTHQKGHEERDRRERELSQLVLQLNTTILENTTTIQKAIKTMEDSHDATVRVEAKL